MTNVERIMNRRSFMGSILALGVAPAIIRVDYAMRLLVPRWVPWAEANYVMDQDWDHPRSYGTLRFTLGRIECVECVEHPMPIPGAAHHHAG